MKLVIFGKLFVYGCLTTGYHSSQTSVTVMLIVALFYDAADFFWPNVMM